MVRKLAYIFLLIFSCTMMLAGNKHALTVFISEYPQGSGWNSLNSSNDKKLLMPILREMGFLEQNIICLEDQMATYANICRSFEELISRVRKGDEVYIHFCCHGQQISDIDADEALVNNKDKFDEALIPYDASIAYDWNGYKGEKHLLDDTVNMWLGTLAAAAGRDGLVVFVADACHSGDLKRTKGIENFHIYRGTFDAFRLPLPVVKTARSPHQLNWVSISACKDFQTNYECEADGVKYGRLSYALSRCISSGISVKELIGALKREYDSIPLPRGKAQTLEVECPEKLLNKSFF